MTLPSMAVGKTATTTRTITIPPQPAAPHQGSIPSSASQHGSGGAALNRMLTLARSSIATALLCAGLIAGTALVPVPQAQASSQVFPRLAAFDWAKTQAGKPYEYGGTGPGGYDCSGLVYAAYRHAGFNLPRTTQEMLSSSMLGRTNSPNPGELAFFGSDHVEFVTYLNHVTFGALGPGTVLGWHTWYPGSGWQPTVYLYVKGAH
jgi:cell wall-associated NlpC family hydrolase